VSITPGGPALQSALVRFPTSTGRRWLSFDDPVEIITAWDIDEVIPALRRIEAATGQEGLWAAGMLSYDASPAFDPALRTHRHPDVPLLAFGLFRRAIRSRGPAGMRFTLGDLQPSENESQHATALSAIRELIASGDTYQVNHTLRLTADFTGDPLSLFEALCRAQQADHLAYLDLGSAAIASASPELLFTLEPKTNADSGSSTIVSRPMKGTRPRHPVPAMDADLAIELFTSEKDRAENTMIVDMMRNDIGRIATVGTLAVPSLHTIESYPTVHQMTSTVTAETDAGLTDILRAVFPAASITGAPKFRTSQIIADTEGTPRGVYCGSVGVISPTGVAEFNVMIRTAWIDRTTGRLEYGVGGGIVWDSEPSAEYQEAMDKAKVMERVKEPMRLLETLAWHPKTGPTLLDLHVERLARSAQHFGFDVDLNEVRRALESFDANESTKLRLLVSSDGAIDLESSPIGPRAPEPMALPLDTHPVDRSNEYLFHKTTQRQRYETAKARFPDASDVLLWNESGELTETTRGNIVVELDGQPFTPPVSSGLLAGTFRADLLAQNQVTEQTITFADLERATAVWMINSVRGWVTVEHEALKTAARDLVAAH